MIYGQADYFRIPLLDGSFGVGQVFETGADGDGIVFCGISRTRSHATQKIHPLSTSDIYAVVRVSDTSLTSGQWPLAVFDQIPRFRDFIQYDAERGLGFPDHPVPDPAVIEAFTNAVHGLYPWDGFGDLFETIKRPDMDKPRAAP